MIFKDVYQKTTGADEWATPRYIFEPLHMQYGFTLDAAASDENHKCKIYFTKNINGLEQSWAGHRVWVNPPYSRGNIDAWVKKCYSENRQHGGLIVVLLPVSTSTSWFHEWVYHKAEIQFLRGRIKFDGGKNHAPFSSLIAVYGKI